MKEDVTITQNTVLQESKTEAAIQGQELAAAASAPASATEKPSLESIVNQLTQYPNLDASKRAELRNHVLGELFHKIDSESNEYDPESIQAVEIFLENISRHENFRVALQENPQMFDSMFYELSNSAIESERDAEILAHNMLERQHEISANHKEVEERIMQNPLASEEEYSLGIYKEFIESQVREAVFKLHAKGYGVVGSGFDNPLRGTQSIMFDEHSALDLEVFRDVALKNLDGIKKIHLKMEEDRMKIILVPIDPMMDLHEWKRVWDQFADSMPKSKRQAALNNNGAQGNEFRERQDKMRRGADTLVALGFAYINREIVRMSKKDFAEYEKLRSSLEQS